MEEHINQQNSLTGTYRYKDNQIEVLSTFLYEVSIYRVSNNRVNLIKSNFYTSSDLLNVKDSEIIAEFKTFKLQRFITLLGAPITFIKENNLPIFKLYKKKKL